MHLMVTLKRAAFEAAVIVVVAFSLALVVNALRPKGIRLFASPQTAPDKLEVGGDPALSVEAALKLLHEGKAVLLDARPAAFFADGRIRGAVSGPLDQFDEWIAAFMDHHSPETAIITYCDGPQCPKAGELAERLRLSGFQNVFVMPAGWEVWQAQGLPTARGEVEAKP